MERPCRNDRDCLAICDGASLGCQPREANSDGLLGRRRARPEGRKAGLHTRGGAGCGARPVASRCVVGVAVVQGVSSLRPQAQPSLDGSVAMKYGWGANGGCGNAIVNRQARENRTLQEIDGIWPVPYYPSLEKTGAVLVCPTKQGVTRTARTDASSPTRG